MSSIVSRPSPLTWDEYLLRKRADYDRIGLAEVWFVDQVPQVLVCRRPEPSGPYVDHTLGHDDILTSPLLHGFEVRVDELFRR